MVTIKKAQNGCVKIFAAMRRTALFGRSTQSALDEENRKRCLARLTTMNVCKIKKKKKELKRNLKLIQILQLEIRNVLESSINMLINLATEPKLRLKCRIRVPMNHCH